MRHPLPSHGASPRSPTSANSALSSALCKVDASVLPNGACAEEVRMERRGERMPGKFWRVGKLAHGALRNRCPRAAPNPLNHNRGTCQMPQWADGPKSSGTGVVVLERYRV